MNFSGSYMEILVDKRKSQGPFPRSAYVHRQDVIRVTTGQKPKFDGYYSFIGHADIKHACQPNGKEIEGIVMLNDLPAPSIHCGHDVIWELKSKLYF